MTKAEAVHQARLAGKAGVSYFNVVPGMVAEGRCSEALRQFREGVWRYGLTEAYLFAAGAGERVFVDVTGSVLASSRTAEEAMARCLKPGKARRR